MAEANKIQKGSHHQGPEHSPYPAASEPFRLSGGRLEKPVRKSSDSFEAVMRSGTVLANGFQNLSREWMRCARESVQLNVDGWNNVMRSRTSEDLVTAYNGLFRQNLENMSRGYSNLCQLSITLADEAVQKKFQDETAAR